MFIVPGRLWAGLGYFNFGCSLQLTHKAKNDFVLNLRADLSPGRNRKLFPNISKTYPSN